MGSVGVNGAVWPWYSNGVNSDASNSLTVYLTQIRGGTTHRMRHDENSPGSLGQSSGVTPYAYSYSGIPGYGNDCSATGVILKYLTISAPVPATFLYPVRGLLNLSLYL